MYKKRKQLLRTEGRSRKTLKQEQTTELLAVVGPRVVQDQQVRGLLVRCADPENGADWILPVRSRPTQPPVLNVLPQTARARMFQHVAPAGGRGTSNKWSDAAKRYNGDGSYCRS